MLVRVNIERVTLDTATSRFVVILRDVDQNRWLPIVVGSTEAQAIALQLESIEPPRPLTHDLLKNVLDTIDVSVKKITVNDLRDNTYFAIISLEKDGEVVEVDARPSDAIALALRVDAEIYVDDSVLKKASISEREPNVASKVDAETPDSFGDKLEQLNISLMTAVQEENYEEAAKIRDEIKNLREEMRSHS